MGRVDGNVPLLITFAHAGTKRVQGIAQTGGGTARADPGLADCGFNSSPSDARTRGVAEAILDRMEWRGMRPYMIVPYVSRRDVDLNRSWNHNQTGYRLGGVGRAAQGLARRIYRGFYDEMQAYVDEIERQFGAAEAQRAHCFDIHGIRLSSTIDIEMGTRGRTSADPDLVYDGGGALTLIQALLNQEFQLRSSAATTEPFGGCEVLRRFGLGGGGLNAVQIELSALLRGSAGVTADDKRRLAAQTGERLAMAFEAFLQQNGYPVEAEPVASTEDDEIYAALAMASP